MTLHLTIALVVCVAATVFFWERGIPSCNTKSEPGPAIADAIKISGC